MSRTTLPTTPRPGTAGRARAAVLTTFIAHSVPRTSWTPYIPLVKHDLALSDATLGTALLGAPAGSLVAMLAVGPVLPRIGSRRAAALVLAGYAISGIGLGLAHTAPTLFAALFCWGLFQGALDVTMNAQGVTVEQATGRPIMSGFHAAWSLGGFAGVGIGALAIAAGVPLVAYMAAMTVLVAVLGLVSVPAMLDDHTTAATGREAHDAHGGLGMLRVLGAPAVLVLGLLTAACMLCEGAVADWSAVYLHDTVSMSTAGAALGFAGYSVTMVALRLVGDRMMQRWPARTLLPVLCAMAAAGSALPLLAPVPAAGILGFALLGIGTALVVPATFSAAGRLPGIHTGPAVAAVSALGWMGYVAGPPLIGHLADATTMRAALAVVPALMAVTAIGSRHHALTLDPNPNANA